MKTKKKIIIYGVIVLLIIIFMLYSISYVFLQEDLIFFQFFHSKIPSEGNSTNTIQSEISTATYHNKEVIFEVAYKNTKFKSLNLIETIHNKTLIYEKIAPGTSGNFDILLKSKQDMQYAIQFKSKNEKPSNLQFSMSEKGKRYSSLEELGKELRGNISENEKKIIPIYWEWKYEGSEEKDKKDTLEGKNLKEYQFLIYVQGY